MLFVAVFALFASVAFAAPSVDGKMTFKNKAFTRIQALTNFLALPVKHLDAVVDIAIAEMATRQPRTFNEVTLSGLDSLKRTTCQLKGDVYTCLAVAEKAVVNSPEHKNLKVVVKIPIGVQVNGDVFQKFIIGEVEVEEADEVITEDGLFGFWKKVKKAVGKAGKAVVKGAKKVVKTAAQIALEEAKNVAHQKANVSFTLSYKT